MKLFGSYLKYRVVMIVTYVLIVGIFASSYLLFDMPKIAVLYPLVLTLCISLAAAAADFVFFVRRHNRILSEELPEPKDRLEEDYQFLIEKMKEEADMAGQKASADYTDMVDTTQSGRTR